MSVSHSVLPGPFHTSNINPRPEFPARHNPARASDATMVRLPSYKELTASCGEVPPPHKSSRSNLFTAGLIHLPPLKVLTQPTSPISPSSLHKIPTKPLGQMKRRYYDDDDSDDSPEAHRYLDLSLHCPLPPRDPRVGSPQSTDSAASSSSSRPGPWSPTSAHSLPSASAHNSHGHASTLPSPGSGVAYDLAQAQPRLKFSHAKAGGRTKKQALSCYFCRERKIAYVGGPMKGIRMERAINARAAK
ncbi:hypothetical protein MVEN_00803600 [Mycena venus]|uniref:Uncharacterized protein n=1 Tax=Mycena venus TaxID=2733690 RepID=A0A8H7D637_9AGAR|nr:hypothetical protein MVEN_00803600 [Mycena venus]